MAKNILFTEQEQHILINYNAREDGTLINNKKEVAFTICSNQLNGNNMNQSSSEWTQPRSHDISNKVLPL